MAKRFTDTDIWDKEWFMKLSLKHKCLVRFLFDKCDASGVWSANWMLASSYIGEPVTESDLKEIEERVVKFAPGKFFIVDFIQFQYGQLSENCKPHIKIISLLKKHNLFERVSKGYTNPIQRVEEEDKDKEEEKDKEKEESRELEILLQPVDTEKKEIALKILRDFGFNEISNPDKLRTISAALHGIITAGRLQYFSEQYRNYWEYKKISGERTHNLPAFFADPPGWDSANWTEKLKNLQKENPTKVDQFKSAFYEVVNDINTAAAGY